MKPLKLGVLGSTRGTILEPIIQAVVHKRIKATIEVVISDKQDAFILQRAHQYRIPAHLISPQGLERVVYDQAITETLSSYKVDLILLIGYLRILSPAFVNQWQGKIINIHPSLLPAFAGLMDLKAHRAVLDAKVKISGCTVHYVTHDVDAGPIIVQKSCAVLSNDTPESLKMRVQQLEGPAMIEAINTIIKQHEEQA